MGAGVRLGASVVGELRGALPAESGGLLRVRLGGLENGRGRGEWSVYWSEVEASFTGRSAAPRPGWRRGGGVGGRGEGGGREDPWGGWGPFVEPLFLMTGSGGRGGRGRRWGGGGDSGEGGGRRGGRQARAGLALVVDRRGGAVAAGGPARRLGGAGGGKCARPLVGRELGRNAVPRAGRGGGVRTVWGGGGREGGGGWSGGSGQGGWAFRGVGGSRAGAGVGARGGGGGGQEEGPEERTGGRVVSARRQCRELGGGVVPAGYWGVRRRWCEGGEAGGVGRGRLSCFMSSGGGGGGGPGR